MVELGAIVSTFLEIFVIAFAVIFAIGVGVALFILYRRRLRYGQFKCIIWRKDGFGQLTETYDKGGIFVDKKTKNKRLFLDKNKVGLDPDDIPYIPSGKGKKIIYLLQTGLKNFHYIKPNISNPDITLTVGEEDVNWSINAYERNKNVFSWNTLMQYLPYIAFGFVTVIILIIFIYLFKQFDVLADVANSLKEAAEVMARAEAGTVIIE